MESAKKKELLEQSLKKMKILKQLGDEEVSHTMADKLLCDILKELGFEELVNEFNKLDKCYA